MPIVLATADSPEFDFGGGSTVPAFEWWQYGASDSGPRQFRQRTGVIPLS